MAEGLNLIRYRRRRPSGSVEAVKLTQRNGAEVAAWCGGESFDVGMAPGLCHHVEVPHPDGSYVWAKPGDYIRKNEAGAFAVLSAARFASLWELAA